MNVISAHEVRCVVLAHLQPALMVRGLAAELVPDDFDLLTEGVIDSLALVELIAAVEQHFQIEIDFEALDPESLTIIGPFCRYIAQKAGGIDGTPMLSLNGSHGTRVAAMAENSK